LHLAGTLLLQIRTHARAVARSQWSARTLRRSGAEFLVRSSARSLGPRPRMALRKIFTYPAPELKRLTHPVENIDGRIDQLVTDLVETMYAAPGVGLAATQVGARERVIVLDVDHQNPGKRLLKLINPVIVESEGSIVWEEGCLSVVDYAAEVTRAQHVLVKAWTPDEHEIQIEGEDLLAVALQHEIDHLDGKLFIDRISKLKRDLYRRRVKKWQRDGVPLAAKKPAVSI
jgi:peptide deformylase